MEEVWKDIPGYEGKYQVSNYGNVRSLNYRQTKESKLMTPVNNGLGYFQIGLRLPKQSKKLFYIHRLVYCIFNNVDYKTPLQIDHIDTNRSNNKLENLRLVTCKENLLNPLTTKKRKQVHRIKEGIPCGLFDLGGNLLKSFISYSEAAEYLGCSRTNILYHVRSKSRIFNKVYKIRYI